MVAAAGVTAGAAAGVSATTAGMATATFGKSGIANHKAGSRYESRNHFEA
jgi:hypothetical protein